MTTSARSGQTGWLATVTVGAGSERSPERPIPTVEQVDQIAAAIDPRFRALVYLATYTTLRYGELFALRRRSIDLEADDLGLRAGVPPGGRDADRGASEDRGRRPGRLDPGQPASGDRAPPGRVRRRGGRRAGVSGREGAVPRTANWSKMWCKVTASIGIEGLHFYDLRHTGNTLAASTAASTKDLMARMGHASPRAALIYQHATREREDAIAAGLDTIVTRRRTGSRPPRQ